MCLKGTTYTVSEAINGLYVSDFCCLCSEEITQKDFSLSSSVLRREDEKKTKNKKEEEEIEEDRKRKHKDDKNKLCV